MFTPGLHAAFDGVDIGIASLFKLLGNKLGRSALCAYDIYLLIFRQNILYWIYTLKQVKIWCIVDFHITAFDFPIIEVICISSIKDKQVFMVDDFLR
ncbi:hypothetical protein AYJ66_17190 [Dietzia cinnamea]|nr:hypothetical protein AYJ66_17190 [Dietzia cinnamea]